MKFSRLWFLRTQSQCLHSKHLFMSTGVVFLPDSNCGPRLSAEAADKLKNRYILMRNGAAMHEKETGHKTTIPITVR